MSRTHDVTISAFDLDRIESELASVTEQRDRLAVVLKNIRAGYGGQTTAPDCGCKDCEYLRPIDEALAAVEGGQS
jgi:hypothetical protein